MKTKKSSGDFRQDNDSFKGKRKLRLTPVKKQKSKRTQFFDEIDEFEDDELIFKSRDVDDLDEDLYDDPDDFDEEDNDY